MADGTIKAAPCPWLFEKGLMDAAIALIPFAHDSDVKMLLDTLKLEPYSSLEDAMSSTEAMFLYSERAWEVHRRGQEPRRLLLWSDIPIDEDFLVGFMSELFHLQDKVLTAASFEAQAETSSHGVDFVIRDFIAVAGKETFGVKTASSEHAVLGLQWAPLEPGYDLKGGYDFEAPIHVDVPIPPEFRDLQDD